MVDLLNWSGVRKSTQLTAEGYVGNWIVDWLLRNES